MEMTVDWKGGLEFAGELPSGHNLTLDSSEENGGANKGPRPLEVLLHGLAGCTGIDVVLVLEKMREEVTDFSMNLKAERAPEHPRRFTDIHITYKLKGRDLDEDKVERAIELSKDKYCSASATFNSEITYDYIVEDAG